MLTSIALGFFVRKNFANVINPPRLVILQKVMPDRKGRLFSDVIAKNKDGIEELDMK